MCRCLGVQGFRGLGVQVFRCSGVQVFRVGMKVVLDEAVIG